MPELTRPPHHERLLIKVIMPKQGTERKVPSGGTPPKLFRTVDTNYRNRLSSQENKWKAKREGKDVFK